MRIKKIHIIKYGPVSDLELDMGSGLQVIIGKNEAGKTLTVDAVIKMLLEGKVSDFDGVDRVEEEPEGYILFQDDEGKEKKVNTKKGLARYIDLASLDLRNIFVIRDSDLTLRDECGYFRNITDKLTGLQLERIGDVMSYIQKFGRLVNPSSDSRLSNNMEYDKIVSLRSQALSFEEEAREYIDSAATEKLDYLELEQIGARHEINVVREAIKSKENILEWEDYKKNMHRLEKLREHLKVYIAYREFDQENYERISNLLINIGSLKDRVERSNEEMEKNARKKDILEERQVKVLKRLEALEKKKQDLDRLKSDMEIFNRRKAEEAREPDRFPRIITIILLILAPLSFPAVYIPTRNLPYSFILPVILLAAGLVIFMTSRYGTRSNRLVSERVLLENEFKKIGFKIKDLEEVLPAAAEFEESYRETEGERDSLRDQLRLLELEEGRISVRLDNDARGRKVFELELEEMLGRLGIKDIGEFNEKRRVKNRTVSEISAIARSLEEISGKEFSGLEELDKNSEDLEAVIGSWEEKISGSRPEGDPPAGKETASKKQLEDLRDRIEELEEMQGGLKIKLEDHRNNLNDFQRRYTALDLPKYIDGAGEFDMASLERLKEAAELCRRFIDFVDRRYKMAVEAIRIFEHIRDTEETKVSELFQKLDISGLFKKITGGKYTEVGFDSQTGKVMVVDKQGNGIPAEKLSKGAYDQLFMAIRIIISGEILGNGSGFFIIDDAFLSSDSDRLERQFGVLKELADRGWSIIYFSVKDEVARLSPKYTKNMVIEMK